MTEQAKHLILGTAGHVDHGKTALIRALTGIECDTHKEEKTRGITINLGFAHLDLPSGTSLGIIDVPGHKDFVHTMVGGASGIDIAMLVIAADSGVMPQTREHLQIMNTLGIKTGLIALSRIDLTETDIVDIAEEEIRDLLKGSFLEDCPIVRVSAVTGAGIDDLKVEIDKLAEKAEQREAGQVFRMFADRIFSVSGFGTVVTGSVIGGSLAVGDRALVLPGRKTDLRVRRLERHGAEVETIHAGDRASINLVGLDRDDFRRGMIVADRPLHDTVMLDAQLDLFSEARTVGLWTQVIFHVGTYEKTARLHLLDCNKLLPGCSALVQIHLQEPCVVQHGDRFVIRSSSNDMTLGGGTIVDASPLHHKRRPERLIANLRQLAEGERTQLIVAEVIKSHGSISHKAVADNLNLAVEEVAAALDDHLPTSIVSFEAKDDVYLVSKSELSRLHEGIAKDLTVHHRRNPLDRKGRTTEELRGALALSKDDSTERFLRAVLEALTSKNVVKEVEHTWIKADHTVAIDPELQRRLDFVESFLKRSGMKTPLMSELEREAKRMKMDKRDINHVLRYLVSDGAAYLIESEYLHASVVNKCRDALLKALAANDAGMTVADFRNLVNGNRKICLLLLAIYDAEGVTKRSGDVRVITDKGLKLGN